MVAPCPWIVGDLSGEGLITLADAILMVNYIFKSGPAPQPYALIADTDCSGDVKAADIIYLVNYTGKSGPEPCPCFIPPQ